jgi:acetyl esterase/lipase
MTTTEHVYASREGGDLSLSVFPAQEDADLRTAVLMLHGGGWRLGDRSAMEPAARRLAERGLTCIPVSYRLLTEAPWPAPLEDVREAVRWVRSNAGTLGVDPERIVLYGQSSGGHMALLAAAEAGGEPAADVAAVISFYAPTLFEPGPVGPPMELRSTPDPNGFGLGAYHVLERDATQADADGISPVSAITPSFPPTFLIHGSADAVIQPEMTRTLYRVLEANGVPCDLHMFGGQIHHFDEVPSFANLIDAAIVQFLDRMIVDPKRYEQEQMEHNSFAQLLAAHESPAA